MSYESFSISDFCGSMKLKAFLNQARKISKSLISSPYRLNHHFIPQAFQIILALFFSYFLPAFLGNF